jgi:transcriptional regulator with XRE-family HTH domain
MAAMHEKELTLSELSQLLGKPASRGVPVIRNWLAGKNFPTLSIRPRLAEVLNLTTAELMPTSYGRTKTRKPVLRKRREKPIETNATLAPGEEPDPPPTDQGTLPTELLSVYAFPDGTVRIKLISVYPDETVITKLESNLPAQEASNLLKALVAAGIPTGTLPTRTSIP